MKKTLILGFEGMPGSGKTLISSYLNGFLHPYVIIPETSYCPIPLDTTSNERMIQRDIWHLEQNQADLQIAQHLKEIGIHVGLDRTYVSTLAFSYALSTTQSTNHFNTVRQHFESRKKDFESNVDVFIYFNLCETESIRRFKKKFPIARPMQFFLQPDFLGGMKTYYDQFFSNMPQEKLIEFDINATDYKRVMKDLEHKLIELSKKI
jgi:thymidylate kinase